MEPNNAHVTELIVHRRSKGTFLPKMLLELELFKHLPHEFKLRQKEINNMTLLQVELDAASLKLPALDKSVKSLQFDILIDQNFPILPPKLTTLTNVLHINMDLC